MAQLICYERRVQYHLSLLQPIKVHIDEKIFGFDSVDRKYTTICYKKYLNFFMLNLTTYSAFGTLITTTADGT